MTTLNGISYNIATAEDLWEYVQRPRRDRYTLLDRKECAQPQCQNIVWQPGDDGKERIHEDVTWTVNETTTEKEIRVQHEGEWKHEKEGYEVNDKKELRRVLDHMIIEVVITEQRLRTTEKQMRPPGRVVCSKCRDVIYCSQACWEVDVRRHKKGCPKNPPDILKFVVNEDSEGVMKIIWDRGNAEALRFFAGHSIWEFAEEAGNQDIMTIINAAIIRAMESCDVLYSLNKNWTHPHTMETVTAILKSGCDIDTKETKGVKGLDIIKTYYAGDLERSKQRIAERKRVRAARHEFQDLSLYTEKADFDGVNDLFMDIADVEESIIDQDTERYDYIHELRPDLVDYKRDINFAAENKASFMKEWLYADLQMGLDVMLHLQSKGLPLDDEWKMRKQIKQKAPMQQGMAEIDLLADMTPEERREEEREAFEPTILEPVDRNAAAAPEGSEFDDLPPLVAAC